MVETISDLNSLQIIIFNKKYSIQVDFSISTKTNSVKELNKKLYTVFEYKNFRLHLIFVVQDSI